MNNAAIKIHVQLFAWKYVFISLEIIFLMKYVLKEKNYVLFLEISFVDI